VEIVAYYVLTYLIGVDLAYLIRDLKSLAYYVAYFGNFTCTHEKWFSGKLSPTLSGEILGPRRGGDTKMGKF